MRIAIVLGTRPEIIKLSPIIRRLEEEREEYFVIHTGQHYSYNMDRVFFEQLRLPQPKYNLQVGSGTHAVQTAKMLVGIEKILFREKPDVVLVQGDTNTTLSGALAASKLGIKVGHVEAGLRSFDRSMPEEINRILTDHISYYLFAPTEKARENLLKENIDDDKIYVTGNTIVDALYQNLKLTDNSILKELSLKEGGYILMTMHRQENVDNPTRLKSIISGIELVAKDIGLPIIYPIHPRTSKRLKQFKMKLPEEITTIPPLDYLSFLKLEEKAKLILTDSGGVQEEACILRVPCVTIRDNTERPETLEVGANILAGTQPTKILESAKTMINKKRNWKNPFGDGTSAEKVLKIILVKN